MTRKEYVACPSCGSHDFRKRWSFLAIAAGLLFVFVAYDIVIHDYIGRDPTYMLVVCIKQNVTYPAELLPV